MVDRPSATQRLQAAWAKQQAGRLVQAEHDYRQLLLELPGHPEILNRLGVLYTQSGRPQQALQAFSDAAAAAPADPALQSNLARSALQLGWPETAHDAARRAVDLGAGATAWSLLATALKDLDRLDEAVEACRHGLRHDAGDPALRFNLATCLLLAGRSAEALEVYRRLVAEYPRRPRFRHGLGSALAALGDRSSAELAYRQTLQLAPQRQDTRVDLAVLLLQLCRASEALAVLQPTAAPLPLSPAAIAVLGVAAWEAAERRWVERLLDWPQVLLKLAGPQLDADERIALISAIVETAGLRAASSLKTTRGGRQTGRLGPGSAAPIVGFIERLQQTVAAALDDAQSRWRALDHPLAGQRPSAWQLQVWATVIDAGGFQAPHLHPGGWASGVYYLAVPPDADGEHGVIEFGRPPAELSDWQSGPTLRHAPRPGELLLFPSSSYHRTLPHQGGQQRISIAFDLLPLGVPG